jgi:hypothetical protein
MSRKESPKGQFFTRLEDSRFAYRSSIYGIKLLDSNIDGYKIVLAILGSTLARYYFLMIASRWGVWRDELLPHEILSFPIAFPGSDDLKKRLLSIIDRIINYVPGFMKGSEEIKRLENQLDEAVFDLYSLSSADRELVRERCHLDFDFYFNGSESVACESIQLPGINCGTLETLERMENSHGSLSPIDHPGYYNSLIPYLEVFQKQCAPFIEDGKEFLWQVIAPPGIRMIAVIFTLIDRGGMSPDTKYPGSSDTDNIKAWQDILSQLAEDNRYPIGRRIYIDGMMKLIKSRQIIIIKRSEVWLWTPRAARDDAEAMLLRVIKKDDHPRD